MTLSASEEADWSPLYLILTIEGLEPPIGMSPAGLMGEALLGGDLGGEASSAPFLGESYLNRGGECLLSNDSSLENARNGVPGVGGGYGVLSYPGGNGLRAPGGRCNGCRSLWY